MSYESITINLTYSEDEATKAEIHATAGKKHRDNKHLYPAKTI